MHQSFRSEITPKLWECRRVAIETIKSDDTRRPSWSSALFIEDSMSIDRDCWSLPLSYPETIKSDDMRGGWWSSVSNCFLRLLLFPLISGDNQVKWHADINIVVCFPCWKTQCLSTKATEVSPAIPRQASPIACGDRHGYPFLSISRHQGFC